jgi:hypothetical protein
VLGAAILVGIVREVVDRAILAIARPTTPGAADATLVAQLVGETIALAPFAYFLAGIVIGGVGPVETLKRSIRIARTRWRLAFLVAVTGTVVSLIQVFALGAGLDLAARLASALGLGLDGSAVTATITVVVVLGGIVALGSLLATVTAMIAAPQVVVFLRMTGYSAGRARALTSRRATDSALLAAPRPSSVDAQLAESVLVDAEVVGQFVDHRDPDLVGEVVGVREVLLEGEPEERDPVRDGRPVGAVLGPGNALVEAIERVVVVQLVLGPLVRAGLVVDDDRDLAERLAERRRDPGEGAFDEPLEPDVTGGARAVTGPATALRHRRLSYGAWPFPPNPPATSSPRTMERESTSSTGAAAAPRASSWFTASRRAP